MQALLHVLVCILVLLSVASGSVEAPSHNHTERSSSFEITLGKIPGYAIIKFNDSDVAYLCEIKFFWPFEQELYRIKPRPVILRPLTCFSFSHRVEDILSIFVSTLGSAKRINYSNVFDYEKYSIHITMAASKHADKKSLLFNIISPKVTIDDSAFFKKVFGADAGGYIISPFAYDTFGKCAIPVNRLSMLYSSPPLLLNKHSINGNYIAKLKYTTILHPKTYNYYKITDLNFCFYNSFYRSNMLYPLSISKYFTWCILHKYIHFLEYIKS